MENRMDTVSLPDSEHKRDFTLCVAGPGGLVGVTVGHINNRRFPETSPMESKGTNG